MRFISFSTVNDAESGLLDVEVMLAADIESGGCVLHVRTGDWRQASSLSG